MPQQLVDLVNQYGYLVVFFGAMLDNLGIPSAGDIAVLIGGVFAAQGVFMLSIVILLAICGAAIGDNSAYAVGRFGGRNFLAREKGRIRIPPHVLAKGEAFFLRHGSKSVFLGRFLPGMRSVAPFLAGLNKMPYLIFFLSNLSAVVLWAVGLGLLAYFLGSNWEALTGVLRDIRIVILVVAGAGAAGALIYLIARRRRP